MLPLLLGRLAAAALALVLCAGPADAYARSGAPAAPVPAPRPMTSDPASRPDFHLTWQPDPRAANIAGFPYPRLTPGQLISNPANTDHTATRKCSAANSTIGALRNSVAAVDWYCFDNVDSASSTWTPQGMSGSEDAHPGGTVDGKQVFLTSWYGHRPNNSTPTRSRVSFLVAGTPGRYAHVELVRLVPGAARFGALPTHAGGVVWRDNYLYVADPRRGLLVFDTRNILDLGRTDDPRAPGSRFVLPQVGIWSTGSTLPCNRGTRACYDYVTLDRSASSWQFITGEYCSQRQGGVLVWCNSRLARWRTSDITSRTAGRTIHAQEVFRQPVTNVQGGVSYTDPTNSARRCYYFDSSRGENNLGWLVTDRPNRTPASLPGGVGLQDLYVQRANHQLWTVTEWPGLGTRIVYGVNQPSCP
ncbi:hypothetical protein [Streptomyces shenzhenensis]|uniref:hypothetical protein n=1 Tax=Streptomyces shenzhenensis TaxID=943815 RepID=UPI0015EFEE96|nr:hypothetical protein [Streptomyces shenzhenensis]